MKISFLLVSLLPAFLAGCATFPSYIEPETSSSALVTFTEKTPLIPSWLTFQDQENCQNRRWFKRNIDEFSGTSTAYKVEADTLFTLLSTLEHNRSNACVAISSFTPKVGEEYDIEFVVQDKKCDVIVTDSENKIVTHVLREKVTPFGENGKWCGSGKPNNVFRIDPVPLIIIVP